MPVNLCYSFFCLPVFLAFVFSASISVLSPANSQPLSRYKYQRGLMGTQFTIILYTSDSLVANYAYSRVSARMDSLNQIMSDYLDGSEINRLSETSGTGQWVPVSEPLFNVLSKAHAIASLSGRRFDPTIGPLSQLWRRAVRQKAFPKASERRSARRVVGYQLLALNASTRSILLKKAGMRLDLGGIGQGFAVDEAAKTLQQLGITSFLLDLGGDILVGDSPPERPAGWRIDVGSGTHARPDPADTLVLVLKNAAVTTSGDTYRHLDINGKRYSHIMDPRSGLGLTHFVRTTVLAPDGYRADALTKVFSIASRRSRKRLATRFPEVKVWVLENKKGRLHRWQSTP